MLELARPWSGGMVPMPRPVTPRDIREEGQRLGFEGEALEEFLLIMIAVGDRKLELIMRRMERELRRSSRQ